MKGMVVSVAMLLALSACKPEAAQEEAVSEAVEKPGVSRIEACQAANWQGDSDTIGGYACYADQMLVAGEVQWAAKPVRFATVELLRNSDDVIIAATQTDANGRYQLSTVGLSAAQTYRVRVLSAGSLSSQPSMVVGGSGYPYAVASPAFSPRAGNIFEQDLVVDTDKLGPAYNVLDQMVSAQQYLLDIAGVAAVPSAKAIWFDGNEFGTFYCPPGYAGTECEDDDIIHLLGATTDNDGYDDTVILHEYGHFALSHFSRDDNIGGAHYLHETEQDLRVSWSEGFATTFGALVRQYAGEEGADIYRDTDGEGVVLFSYGLEGPVGGAGVLSPGTFARGMANEVAVSVMLWDIADDSGVTEAFDTLGEPNLLWDTLLGMRGLAGKVSFQDLWELWPGSDLAALVEDRWTFMKADEYEALEPTGPPALEKGWLNRQSRTLHNIDDVDWALIDVQEGIACDARTVQLLSGADTVLSLFEGDGVTPVTDSQGNPVTNDDASPSTFGSHITFVPARTGNYLLKVERYWDENEFARYGSYDLVLECQG